MSMHVCVCACVFTTARRWNNQAPPCSARHQSWYKMAWKGEWTSPLCIILGVVCIPTWARFCETTLSNSSFTLVLPGRVSITASVLHSESLPHPSAWVKPIRSVSSLPQSWSSPRRPRAKKLQLSHHTSSLKIPAMPESQWWGLGSNWGPYCKRKAVWIPPCATSGFKGRGPTNLDPQALNPLWEQQDNIYWDWSFFLEPWWYIVALQLLDFATRRTKWELLIMKACDLFISLKRECS